MPSQPIVAKKRRVKSKHYFKLKKKNKTVHSWTDGDVFTAENIKEKRQHKGFPGSTLKLMVFSKEFAILVLTANFDLNYLINL